MKNTQDYKRSSLRFLVLIVFLALTWFLGRAFNIDLDYYKNLLSRVPLVFSGLIFTLSYVIVSFFIWMAKDIFKIVGAVLFGAVFSSLFIFIAELINASILFHLSRFLGREFIERKLKGGLANLDEKIARSGFWGVFVFRIIPLVPYRFLDIAAGLTKISFRQYILAVILGSPVRVFWLQYILAVLGENVFKNPEMIAAYFSANPRVLFFSSIYLVCSIILALLIKRKFKASK